MADTLPNKLFWIKYRPKTLRSTILLPRVRDVVERGLEVNLILHGPSGTGKTTVARLLCEGFHALELNTSAETSVDLLKSVGGRRGKILDHIHSMPPVRDGSLLRKAVFLDEFERASPTYQDAFKGFIEMYPDVRFVLTTNYIQDIDPHLSSRFTKLGFDPATPEESEYLRSRHVKYLEAVAGREGMTLDPGAAEAIVRDWFPDLREATQALQVMVLSGRSSYGGQAAGGGHRLELFGFLLDGHNDPVENYELVMSRYSSRFRDAFDAMGRPFFAHLVTERPDLARSRGRRLLELARIHNSTLGDTTDPLVHLASYICEVKATLGEG